MAEPELKYVMEVSALKFGQAMPIQIDERWFVVCNDRGQFYLADNACPHAGGSLGKGTLNDGCIVCPVHRWPWNLRTGLTGSGLHHIRLKRYRCEIRTGKLYVDITKPIWP